MNANYLRFFVTLSELTLIFVWFQPLFWVACIKEYLTYLSDYRTDRRAIPIRDRSPPHYDWGIFTPGSKKKSDIPQ